MQTTHIYLTDSHEGRDRILSQSFGLFLVFFMPLIEEEKTVDRIGNRAGVRTDMRETGHMLDSNLGHSLKGALP